MGRASMGKAPAIADLRLSGSAPMPGRLPRGIYWQRGNVSISFPLTTMLALSAVRAAVVFVVSRLMGHR